MATTYNGVGANNGGGDARALFLKMYGGEVLASFNAVNKMQNFHKVMTVGAGKSFQFPVIGRANAVYWDGTTELEGQSILNSEVNIDLDALLYHDIFVREIDELMDHIDKRQEYSRQQGEALANTFDKNVLRQAILTARAASTITGQEGGTEVTSTNAKTSATALAAAIHLSAQRLDEKFVPEDNRYCFVRPAQYRLLSQETNLINKDWDGDGSYSKGIVGYIGGIGLVKTNNLPIVDESSASGVYTKYRGDFSNVAALVMTPEAVGTVRRMGITTEMDYKTEKQATHVVSKTFVGHGKLRPECAVEINVTANE